ncbi:MAG: hypothetical protein KDB14_00375 [Planctomycetales bacterium]|nr:hypothetical protein [Planctomycetales bacterium]
MPFEKHYNQLEPAEHEPCIHLRSKAIYVTGELKPHHSDEDGSHYCWCNLTQHVIGPDKSDVEHRQCGPGRECYRDSHG